MGLAGDPKIKKASLQKKYKRRMRSLSRALDRYLEIAQAKLDRSQSGKIYNRARIEHLVFKTTELSGLLSDQERPRFSPRRRYLHTERRPQTPGPGEKGMIDADEFFKGLTQDEWEELKRAFNKRPD